MYVATRNEVFSMRAAGQGKAHLPRKLGLQLSRYYLWHYLSTSYIRISLLNIPGTADREAGQGRAGSRVAWYGTALA